MLIKRERKADFWGVVRAASGKMIATPCCAWENEGRLAQAGGRVRMLHVRGRKVTGSGPKWGRLELAMSQSCSQLSRHGARRPEEGGALAERGGKGAANAQGCDPKAVIIALFCCKTQYVTVKN